MFALKKFIEYKAYRLRVSSLVMTSVAGSGHPTSALSAADLVAALFFYAMKFDPQNFENPNNDRFILSKGHASPVLYAVYKELGLLSDAELATYRQFNSVLEGHPTARFKYTQAATGSLGMGLSIGAGMALTAKMDKLDFKTYVLMGDSEIAEGSVWEAAEIAAFYKLDNLIAILDVNGLGQSTQVMHDQHMQRYVEKFAAFGFKTFVIDGHDMQQIMTTLDKAREVEGHPVIIIAKTIKGYGLTGIEGKEGYHGKAFGKEETVFLLKQMEERFYSAAHFAAAKIMVPDNLPNQIKVPVSKKSDTAQKTPQYKITEEVATRKAYGQALADLGTADDQVVCLDAEVKNSTYAEIFEQKHPDRFVQCFIAEQNMVSMAVGMQKCKKVPFVSTFAAFFSRAHDQIRMAAVGSSAIRLCGSHAGVSIGQDGPSQMGLEDIGLMQALPNSVVLYPCDAVSAYKLVQEMGNYTQGISYLRTTRMATPVLYDNAQEFSIGGCNVVKQSENDQACLIGAGITLWQALGAYEKLQQEGINVSVIDLYSIKPMDAQKIMATAHKSKNIIITAEDHYLEGGIGQAVTYAMRDTDIYIECLAVTQLPRSGTPEQLLAWAGIDADAIYKKVKELIA